MLLVVPLVTVIDLGAFDVLAPGVATLAQVFPEPPGIGGKEQISLDLLKELKPLLAISHALCV